MHYYIVGSTFIIVFLAELPDKTMISSIILGSKLVPSRVFFGASAAFLFQVIIAVAVGGLVATIPKTPLDIIVGVVFLLGAALVVREIIKGEVQREASIARRTSKEGLIAQLLLAFAITFVAEFGDLTQIATANLAARTGDPISVGVGAFLGLLAVTALAVFVGSRMLSRIPIKPVQIVSTLLLIALGLYSILSAT